MAPKFAVVVGGEGEDANKDLVGNFDENICGDEGGPGVGL